MTLTREMIENGSYIITDIYGACILGSESATEAIDNFFDGHDYYILNGNEIFEDGEQVQGILAAEEE